MEDFGLLIWKLSLDNVYRVREICNQEVPRKSPCSPTTEPLFSGPLGKCYI